MEVLLRKIGRADVESGASSPAVLEAQAISKRFGSRLVLDQFAIAVAPRQIHGLLGPNGSGKTTALHIITGLLDLESGAVSIAGRGIRDRRSRSSFGFAPDDLPLPSALTGTEYLRYHDALRARDDSARSILLAEALGIEADLGELIGEYSHGMRRKLQLISAVMHNPDLLILDEPFRGLDPEASATVRTLLITFAENGGAVLIATHDMLRAERDCGGVTILNRGQIVAEGSPSELVESRNRCSNLEDVFMEVTGSQMDLSRRADWVAVALESDSEMTREPKSAGGGS